MQEESFDLENIHPDNIKIIRRKSLSDTKSKAQDSQNPPSEFLANKLDKILKQNEFVVNNVKKYNTLTTREKEILAMIAFGDTNQEIADQLYISVNTAKTHRKNIKNKLEIKTMREIIHYAQAFDLI